MTLAVTKVDHFFFFFRLGKSCESSTLLRVVGAGFTWSKRLHEGNRFVSSKMRVME